MKIKIIKEIPTQVKPKVGELYDVIEMHERKRSEGGNMYFIICEGVKLGILKHECEVVKE
jgi:hypothetical protein